MRSISKSDGASSRIEYEDVIVGACPAERLWPIQAAPAPSGHGDRDTHVFRIHHCRARSHQSSSDRSGPQVIRMRPATSSECRTRMPPATRRCARNSPTHLRCARLPPTEVRQPELRSPQFDADFGAVARASNGPGRPRRIEW